LLSHMITHFKKTLVHSSEDGNLWSKLMRKCFF
jgi:hypothetical protein